jgi:hypothetical protein
MNHGWTRIGLNRQVAKLSKKETDEERNRRFTQIGADWERDTQGGEGTTDAHGCTRM